MIYVIGDGPYAREVLSILSDASGLAYEGIFIGKGDDEKVPKEVETPLLMGVSNPGIKKMLVMRVYTNRLWQHVISKRSVIMDPGKSTPMSIGHMSTIGLDTSIGRFVSICNNVAIGHDVALGDYVTIAPGAIISGFVKIGEGAFIGAGAVIKPGVKIGEWAIVGCGANVVKDVNPNSTVIRNPAVELGAPR